MSQRYRIKHGFAAVSMASCSAFLLAGLAHASDRFSCNLSDYRQDGSVRAITEPAALIVRWQGLGSQNVEMRLGITSGVPVIERLAINNRPVVENARLEYTITTGRRRMSNQQMQPLRDLGIPITSELINKLKWDAFWDAPLDMSKPAVRENAQGPAFAANPPPAAGIADQPGTPRDPNEVKHVVASYAADGCVVSSEGARLSVAFPKMSAGVFSGSLVLTVYQGTNLIRAEYVAKTRETSVAYKYDVGLTGLPINAHSGVAWRDIANSMQGYTFKGSVNQGQVALQAANRLVVAHLENGAIAAFPPPHTFFWAREIEKNVGNNWYRKDSNSSFTFGIRQADKEAEPEYAANWALYSAPADTEQHMAAYFYPTLGDAKTATASAFSSALAFTNGDRFRALPGYKVMANHFHTNLGERLLASGSLDTRLPDFEVLRSAGIDIAGVTDRPREPRASGTNAEPNGPSRLDVMHAYFEGAQRHSDDNFMIMPNIEASVILGGHWDVLLSKPTYWLEKRAPGQPLKDEVPNVGTVYHVSSTSDVMQMAEDANMLIYMPHPRTKGSTFFPDAIAKDQPFNSDRYRGAGWRWGMGSDLSEKRLSEKRVLPLFDEMNNWVADSALKPKYLLSITETYAKEPGDDIYAAGPVNYIKLDKLPSRGDYAPIINVLTKGDYFVTSGEVLIPSHSLTGKDKNSVFTADVQWTFPLDFVEVVWGDGVKSFNKVISAKELKSFGSKKFSVPFDASGAKWARFAAWDSAGNGAMTQPIRIGK